MYKNYNEEHGESNNKKSIARICYGTQTFWIWSYREDPLILKKAKKTL